MNKNIFYALSLSFALFHLGCERNIAQSTKSRVEISFPKTNISLLQESKVDGISPLDFSTIEPTGFSGAYPINCYAVMVSAPEPGFNVNSCGREDGSISRFGVGILAGAVSGGQSITMDVPSGKDRSIKVIGFHALTASACSGLESDQDNSNLSKPYILGEVGGLVMNPGATLTVPVSMSWDNQAWFDDCVGPDFGDGNGSGGGGPAIATRARLAKNFWPINGFYTDSCNQFYIQFQDNQGQWAQLSEPATIQFEDSMANPLNIHNSCDCSGGLTSQVFFAQGTIGEQCLSYTTNSTVGPLAINMAPVSGPPGFDPTSNMSFNVQLPSSTTFEIAGPRRILPNSCHRYQLISRYWAGAGATVSSLGINHANAQTKVYPSLSACQSATGEVSYGIPSHLTLNGGVTKYTDVWVSIDSAAANPSFTAWESGNVDGVIHLQEGSGIGSLAKVRVWSDRNQIQYNTCATRLINIELEDANGNAFPVMSALNVQIDTVSGSAFNFYQPNDFGCAGTSSASLSTSVPAGSSFLQIPFKIPAQGTGTIRVTIPSYPTIQSNDFSINAL